MEALPDRLAAIARSQHALITLEQLNGLEVTRHRRERLLATGHIRRVAHDVYQLGGAPFTWQARIATARFALGSDAVVSHRSAAALYGLDGFDQQQVVHVSIPASRSPRKPANVRIHRCFDYEFIEPRVQQGIIVTDPARLVLDLYAGERNRSWPGGGCSAPVRGSS